jgi:hypothetical protein
VKRPGERNLGPVFDVPDPVSTRRVLSVFAVIAISVLMVPAAHGATKLTGDTIATSLAAASPDSPQIVTLTAPGKLQISIPGTVPRTLEIPDNCGLTQAITATEAFVCSGDQGDPIAINLKTGTQRTLPKRPQLAAHSSQELFTPTRAGSRWLAGYLDLGKDFTIDVIVDRTTGRTLDLHGNFGSIIPKTWGAGRYVDLDSARPDQPLCRGVRRPPVVPGSAILGPLTKVGSWTISQTAAATDVATASVLQRCGTTKKIAIPSQQTVLGRKYLAWVQGHRVMLRSLVTGRTRTFLFTHTRADVAMSSNRLIVSQGLYSPTGPKVQINTIPIA